MAVRPSYAGSGCGTPFAVLGPGVLMTDRPIGDRLEQFFAALKEHGLTRKQAEVAMHIALHLSEAETAAEIGCHVSAVKKRLNGVKKKLGTEKLRRTAARVQEIYDEWHDGDRTSPSSPG